jgi:hypothetical protein
VFAREIFDKPTATPGREVQMTDGCHLTVIVNTVHLGGHKGCNAPIADLMKCLLVTVHHLNCILPNSLIHVSL